MTSLTLKINEYSEDLAKLKESENFVDREEISRSIEQEVENYKFRFKEVYNAVLLLID